MDPLRGHLLTLATASLGLLEQTVPRSTQGDLSISILPALEALGV